MRGVTVVLFPIFVGLILRLIGLQHGDGVYVFHPDIAKQIRVAEHIYRGANHAHDVYKNNLELEMYPYGTATLLGRAATWGLWITGQNMRFASTWEWGVGLRIINVVMGLGCIAIVLLALRRAFGDGPTLLTGLMLVVEPLHSQISHYGMNDVPMVGLLLLCWLAAAVSDRDRGGLGIYSLAAGFTLGFAFGIKYQALLGGVILLVAWVVHGRRLGWVWVFRSAGSAAIGVLGGLVATCPMLFIDPAHFIQWFPKFMSWQANITGLDLSMAEKLANNVPYVLIVPFKHVRWLLLLPAVLAASRLLKRDASPTERCLIASALGFCGLLVAALCTSRDLVRQNDLLPLLPFLILGAGWYIAQSRLPRARQAATLAVCVFVVTASVSSMRDSLALGRTDTRILARRWCDANIPDRSVVRREPYTLGLGKRVIDREHRYLSLPEVKRVIDDGQFDYLITSSLAHARFFNPFFHSRSEEVQDFYRQLPVRYQEVARFSDRNMMFAHPKIIIYKRPGSKK